MKRVYGCTGVRVYGRAGGRAGVRYVITKFSQMDSLPNFLTHGASRARGAPLLFVSWLVSRIVQVTGNPRLRSLGVPCRCIIYY